MLLKYHIVTLTGMTVTQKEYKKCKAVGVKEKGKEKCQLGFYKLCTVKCGIG